MMNVVSASIVGKAVFELKGGPQIAEHNRINVDATAALIAVDTTAALSVKEITHELNEMCRSVGITQDSEPGRYGHVIPAVSGDGRVVCVVCMVVDNKLKEIKITKVQAHTHSKNTKNIILTVS